MKILVDAFGGDNAPEEIINASLLALFKHKDLKITLVGKAEVIQDCLVGKKYDQARLDILDAREVIGCDEAPVEAIRTKKDSSIVRAIEELKTKPDEYCAFVSAGSTGALLSASVLKLGRLKGVNRPVLAPILPTAKGTPVMLVDSGANMDAKSNNLVQFAMLAHVYMNKVLGVQKPRVALLNVGVEEAKGNELTKEVYPLLKQLPINFVGNMEAREFLSGDYDIVVADGFSGNVLLKSSEGALKMLMTEIKSTIMSGFWSKMGGLLMKGKMKDLKKKFDYEGFGGSVLLGTKGIVIKAHGSTKAKGFLAAIEQAMVIGQSNILTVIESEFEKMQSVDYLQEKANNDKEISQAVQEKINQQNEAQ